MLVEGNQNGNMYMATIDNQLTKKEVVITAIFILLVFILVKTTRLLDIKIF